MADRQPAGRPVRAAIPCTVYSHTIRHQPCHAMLPWRPGPTSPYQSSSLGFAFSSTSKHPPSHSTHDDPHDGGHGSTARTGIDTWLPTTLHRPGPHLSRGRHSSNWKRVDRPRRRPSPSNLLTLLTGEWKQRQSTPPSTIDRSCPPASLIVSGSIGAHLTISHTSICISFFHDASLAAE